MEDTRGPIHGEGQSSQGKGSITEPGHGPRYDVPPMSPAEGLGAPTALEAPAVGPKTYVDEGLSSAQPSSSRFQQLGVPVIHSFVAGVRRGAAWTASQTGEIGRKITSIDSDDARRYGSIALATLPVTYGGVRAARATLHRFQPAPPLSRRERIARTAHRLIPSRHK